MQFENGDEECYIGTPVNAPCQQGLVPTMVANASSVDDVLVAVWMAARYRLKTVIKNTGHDYLGRSSGRGTFTIWTHYLRGIGFIDSFLPDGCAADRGSAVTVAAGEVWRDVLKAADEHNVTVVGAAPSVGAAGGWVLGGGHSPLSPLYGLGVDNVLQFTIVTSDEKFRVVNACQNQDLFWALRGGGGAFGVVTSVTYKIHPPLKSVQAVILHGAKTSPALAAEILKSVPSIMDAGYLIPHKLLGTYALFINRQTSTSQPPDTKRTFGPLLEWAKEHDEALEILYDIDFPSFWSMYEALIRDTGIGENIQLGGRLLPKEVFQGEKEDHLVELVVDDDLTSVFCFVGGGAVSKVSPYSVSVHPAWRSALASVTLSASWPDGHGKSVVESLKNYVTKQTLAMSSIVGPGAAAYSNEADPQEPNWQDVFWGSHYPRLLKIKNKYDPERIWNCNRCVGFEQA